ncbi:MAG: hypothetical protein LUE12_07205 [Ruminococcus sp.]|nr:hypothetical protein [Ruminococcus sp.]
MKILIYILLLLAAVVLVYSIAATAKLFKSFGAEKADEQLKKYRNRMIAAYVTAVVLITAAAAVKIFLM